MYVKTVDYRSPQAPHDFVETLRGTGFAVLSHHPIDFSLVESAYADWINFFSKENKFKYTFDPSLTRQAGYFPFGSENAKGYPVADLKEFYHYRDAHDLPEGMSDCTQQLLDRMGILAVEVLGWLETALPEEIYQQLSIPLSEMTKNSDMTLLRPIHYPALTGEIQENAERAAAHEDIVILTILPAATEPGLQVLDTKGNWHAVSCDPGTLIFNAGDMLQMATKGFYKSTTHRVINPSGESAKKSRYSMPFFFHARSDVRLSDTHTAKSYLDERLAEVGLKSVA